MNSKTEDILLGMIMFLLIVATLFFANEGIEDHSEKMKMFCQSNCEKYHLPFLNSEGSVTKGYACFCLDTDGKPRQVPSE